MEKNERYEDKALRIIMRHEAEESEQMKLSDSFTDRLMQRIQDDDKKKRMQKRRQAWMYTGIAAAVALLIGVAFYFFLPQVEIPKQELVEREDSTNILQDIERLERESPRHPMAQMDDEQGARSGEQGARSEEQGTKRVVRRRKKSTITQPSIPPVAEEEPLLADVEEEVAAPCDTSFNTPHIRMMDYTAYYEQVQQQIRAHIEDVDKSIEESTTYFKGY